MKNYQKGFAVPALLAIIAVLVIGGGMYVYLDKKSETSETRYTTSTNIPLSQVSQGDSIVDTNLTPPTNADRNKNSVTSKIVWSIYTDPTWGYMINIPSSAPNPFQSGFVKISVQNAGNSETYRASQQSSLDLQKKSTQPSRFTFSRVSVNGMEAFKTVDNQSLIPTIPSPKYIVVYDFINGDNLYHVGFTAPMPLNEQARDALSIFEQMVFTFKI